MMEVETLMALTAAQNTMGLAKVETVARSTTEKDGFRLSAAVVRRHQVLSLTASLSTARDPPKLQRAPVFEDARFLASLLSAGLSL